MCYLIAISVLCSQPVTILHSGTPEHEAFIRNFERAYFVGCEDGPLFWAAQDIDARYSVRFVKHHRWTPRPRVMVGQADLGEIVACPCGCGVLKLRDLLVKHYAETYFTLHYEYIRSSMGWTEYRKLILGKIEKGEVPNGFDGVWDWDKDGLYYHTP